MISLAVSNPCHRFLSSAPFIGLVVSALCRKVIDVFFKAHTELEHLFGVLYTDETEMPRLIGYFGYVLLVLRIAQNKTVVGRIFGKPFSGRRVFERSLPI